MALTAAILINLVSTTIQDLTMIVFWKYMTGIALYLVLRSEKTTNLWSLLEPILITLGIVGLFFSVPDIISLQKNVDGQFQDPNLFAEFLLIAITPLSIHYLSTKQSSLQSILYFMLLVGLIFAFTLTNSRGGVLIWVGSMTLLVLFTIKHKIFIASKFLYLMIGSSIGWMSYYFYSASTMSSAGYNYAKIIGSDESSAISVRMMIWRSSIEMFQQLPILGSGLGTFSIRYREYRSPDEYYTLGSSAHNDILHVLVEGGPLLALALIGLIAIAWYRASVYLFANDSQTIERQQNQKVKFSLLVVVIGFSIHGLINFTMTVAFPIAATCVFLALTTPVKATSIPNSTSSPKRKIGSILLLLIIAYFLLTDLIVDNIYNERSKSRNIITLVNRDNNKALYTASNMLTLLRPDKTYPRAYLIRSNVAALKTLKNAQHKKELYELIESEFTHYLESCSICSTAILEYAEFHEQFGNMEIALENHKKLVKQEPYNLEQLLKLTQLLDQTGSSQQAIDMILATSDERIIFANRMTKRNYHEILYLHAIKIAEERQLESETEKIRRRFKDSK